MIDSRAGDCRKLIERGEYSKAYILASELLNESPENPRALYLFGWVLRQQGHVGAALQMFRRALSLEQDVPNIWMHYGACLHDTHQYEDARQAFHRVRKFLPNDPMPIANIAASFVQEGKCNDAIEWADKALEVAPDNKIARQAKAFGCLGLGRWADGWEHVEVMYGEQLRIRVYNPPESEEPVWDGSKGKTVVVQADQGLGDMIMFAQCLPQMIADCKQVIFETNPRLAALIRRNFPGLVVYETLKDDYIEWPKQYQIDARIHLSLLGRFYRNKAADFDKKPYLTADPALRTKWRTWLEQFPRPWVGIAWRGGIAQSNTLARSMELADLAPIIEQGGTPISLAYQDVGLEVAQWNIDHTEQVIVPTIDNKGDYDETVALIAELDHVVTVTTTAAHVCGALGKPAYVLVNALPQWRYGLGGDRMPWYSDKLTLYRQKHGEKGWTHAVARLARDFENFVLPRAA